MVEYKSINNYLASITTFLSFFGTLFIIISFYVWKDIQITSRRILLYISMADFLTSVATIIALSSSWTLGYETGLACKVQSVLGTFSVLASFFWTVFMALYLYITICWKNADLAKKLLPLFHGCGWGIPVTLVSLAYVLGKLGNDGDRVTSGWCWINVSLNWKDQVLWMLLAGKLWEIIAYFVIAVLYALIKRSMKKEVKIMLLIFLQEILNRMRSKMTYIYITMSQLENRQRIASDQISGLTCNWLLNLK